MPNIRTEATGVSRSNICTNSFLLLDLHLPERTILNVRYQVHVFYQPTHIRLNKVGL